MAASGGSPTATTRLDPQEPALQTPASSPPEPRRPAAPPPPPPRFPDIPRHDPRPAAVLCPVFAGGPGDQAHLVLTRRSGRLRSHTGEVSFPGGRIDAGETPIACALREAREEVGIDPAGVEVIGRLSVLSTWSNPASIQPFVGILPERPVLWANPAEVERAFTVPVAELFADGVGTEELWPLPAPPPPGSADDAGRPEERPIYFFAVVGDTVWGATARIIRELLERLWEVLAGIPG
jgi:8-oxo-dGTP pyrophosphatase MutT (NUDIX family)